MGVDHPGAQAGIAGLARCAGHQRLREFEHRLDTGPISARADQPRKFAAPRETLVAARQQRRDHLRNRRKILRGKAQRHAERAFSGSNSGRVRRQTCIAQHRGKLAVRERGKAQCPAARADRGQQARWPMGHQQEKGSNRRLLKAFEQGVGSTFFHVVRRIDDDRTAAPQGRAGDQPALHRADLLDPDAARAFERLAVGLRLLGLVILGAVSENEDIGVLARRLRHAGFGDQLTCGGKRKVTLTEPRLARQQPAMMHPLAAQRIAPLPPCFSVIGPVGHAPAPSSRSPSAVRMRPWTSAGAPSASIRTIPEGSAAAKARKASATAR